MDDKERIKALEAKVAKAREELAKALELLDRAAAVPDLSEAIRRIVWKPKTTVGEIRREMGKLLAATYGKPEATIIRTGPGDPTRRILKKHLGEEDRET